MNSDSRVELHLRRMTFERDGEALDYLARISAHHMASQYPIGLPTDHQFHEAVLVPPAERMFKRPETRLVDVDIAIALAGLGLRETHCADSGLAEDRGRHGFVVRGRGISMK